MIRNIKLLTPLLLGAFSVLASCSDEPEMPSNADASKYIVFDAPKVTLIGAGSRSLLENEIDGSFKVYGYCVPRAVNDNNQKSWASAQSTWNQKVLYSTPDIFQDQTVGSDGVYKLTGNKLREWESGNGFDPNEFRYSFIAHYPADDNSWSMNKKSDATGDMGVPELTFTMPLSGNSIDAPLSHESVKDAMYATMFDHRKTAGRVALRFEHLLSAFRFKVNNYTAFRLKITKVVLKGSFFKSATLRFATTAVERPEASGSYAGTFNILPDGTSQEIGSQSTADTYIGASDDNNNEGVSLLLLTGINPSNVQDYNYLGPAALGSAEAPTLYVDYELYNEQTNKLAYAYTGVKAQFRPSRPLAGTRYAANLNFVDNEFVLVFAPEGDNWEGGSDNDITIN